MIEDERNVYNIDFLMKGKPVLHKILNLIIK